MLIKFEYATSMQPYEKVVKKEVAEQLLEALQEVLSGYESFIDAEWQSTEEHDKERINKARAAIAKALGERKNETD